MIESVYSVIESGVKRASLLLLAQEDPPLVELCSLGAQSQQQQLAASAAAAPRVWVEDLAAALERGGARAVYKRGAPRNGHVGCGNASRRCRRIPCP
eukprot:1180579-Prorocentrum_minimum.AAC.1